jgi:hypothetical protein
VSCDTGRVASHEAAAARTDMTILGTASSGGSTVTPKWEPYRQSRHIHTDMYGCRGVEWNKHSRVYRKKNFFMAFGNPAFG